MYTLMNEARYKSLPPDIRNCSTTAASTSPTVEHALEERRQAIETPGCRNKVVDLPDAKRAECAPNEPVVDQYIAEQERPSQTRVKSTTDVVALKKYE